MPITVIDVLLAGLCVFWTFQTVQAAETFENHQCKRKCEVGKPPMTCEYSLITEWYWVLSKACYDCPFNTTDCFREECVSADGKRRALVTYNKQLPGPKIEVCEGDNVIVWVKNAMADAAATSVHWHGQHQLMTPYMDGVAFLTQCSIDHGQIFKYEFTVGPTGTHWYHSHVGLQIADGLYGPFIVRQPKEADPSGSLYDEDLSEHIVTVSDWKPMPFISRFMDQMHDRFDLTHSNTGLINGRAREFDVENEFNASVPDTKTPVAEFEITQGKRYRFRFIGAASACQFQMSVDNHTVTLIANDGIPVDPIVTDSFIITPGERYDIVINASQPIGNYWMRAIGLGDCYKKAFVYAIVRYTTSTKGDPPGNPKLQRPGILLNPIPSTNMIELGLNHTQTVTADNFKYGVSKTNFTDEVVDATYYTTMFFSNNDNTIFNNKILYPVKELPPSKQHATPVMDNITFGMPPIPILSQPDQVDQSWFCNRSSLGDTDRCLDDLCICTHLIRFKLGQTVDLVVINEGSMFPAAHHPMHLHGYSFRIMGIQLFDRPIKLEEVQQMDREGRLKRNYINPPLRDTFMLPARSVAVLRFEANNPGYWFFHCHVDGHVVQGKALIIQIGDVSQFPTPPKNFPRCGGYGYSLKPTIVKETVNVCLTSTTAGHLASTFFTFIIISSIWIL